MPYDGYMHSFQERINFKGDISKLLIEVAEAFQLGGLVSFKIIEMGFEDFNVHLVTEKGQYIVKIFSKGRDNAQVVRYVETIKRAIAGGVSHPALHTNAEKKELFEDSDSGTKLIVTSYIQGKTFYELARIPNSEELTAIAAEAVKINALDYDPEYIFDGWAIPNMRWMFDKTKGHLSTEGSELVKKAFEYYDAIPFDELPKCFVHGDLIKTNTILGDDGKVYVIDFAVSNTYPRIQELAVMAANLLFDEKSDKILSLKDRVDMAVEAYLKSGGQLTQLEKDNVFNYALPGAAMEYMGSVNERVVGDTSEEIKYWEKLGLDSLREALKA
jgi:Ser/Thr protein kinase RdoA (MazF antagonist)